MFSILAVRFARMDSFNTITSAAYIILMFMSTMFYPLDQQPMWFRTLAWLNPMTWQVDVLRFSLQGIDSLSTAVWEFAAFIMFSLICLSLAVKAIDRAG